jgi:hypothetical protein
MNKTFYWADVYKAANGFEIENNTLVSPLFTEISIRPKDKDEFEKAVRVVGKFCSLYGKFEYIYDTIMYKNKATAFDFTELLKTKIRVENALMEAYEANYIPMFEFKKNAILSNSGIGLLHNKFKLHLENCIHNANIQISHQTYLKAHHLHESSEFLDKKREELMGRELKIF